jgi:hypothetical protein
MQRESISGLPIKHCQLTCRCSPCLFNHAICVVPWVSQKCRMEIVAGKGMLTRFCSRSMVGAAIGGTLAEPVKNYPSVFPKGSIFEQFPYLLPNIVCTGFVVFGLIVGLLFLEETHEDKKSRNDPGLKIGKWFLAFFGSEPCAHRSWLDDWLTFRVEEDEKNPRFGSSESTPRASSVNDDMDMTKHPLLARQQYSWREMFTNQVCLNILSLGILALYVSCRTLIQKSPEC